MEGTSEGLWSNSPQSRANLDQVAQDFVQPNFECLQGWRFPHLSGPLCLTIFRVIFSPNIHSKLSLLRLVFIASPSITVHLGWMSRCIRDIFRPCCTRLARQIVGHKLQSWSQLRQQALGLPSPLDSPQMSRPGWKVSPLHGASVLLLNRSHLYKGQGEDLLLL